MRLQEFLRAYNAPKLTLEFAKNRVFFGAFIIRVLAIKVIVHLGLYWGPPIQGSYHIFHDVAHFWKASGQFFVVYRGLVWSEGIYYRGIILGLYSLSPYSEPVSKMRIATR